MMRGHLVHPELDHRDERGRGLEERREAEPRDRQLRALQLLEVAAQVEEHEVALVAEQRDRRPSCPPRPARIAASAPPRPRPASGGAGPPAGAPATPASGCGTSGGGRSSLRASREPGGRAWAILLSASTSVATQGVRAPPEENAACGRLVTEAVHLGVRRGFASHFRQTNETGRSLPARASRCAGGPRSDISRGLRSGTHVKLASRLRPRRGRSRRRLRRQRLRGAAGRPAGRPSPSAPRPSPSRTSSTRSRRSARSRRRTWCRSTAEVEGAVYRGALPRGRPRDARDRPRCASTPTATGWRPSAPRPCLRQAEAEQRSGRGRPRAPRGPRQGRPPLGRGAEPRRAPRRRASRAVGRGSARAARDIALQNLHALRGPRPGRAASSTRAPWTPASSSGRERCSPRSWTRAACACASRSRRPSRCAPRWAGRDLPRRRRSARATSRRGSTTWARWPIPTTRQVEVLAWVAEPGRPQARLLRRGAARRPSRARARPSCPRAPIQASEQGFVAYVVENGKAALRTGRDRPADGRRARRDPLGPDAGRDGHRRGLRPARGRRPGERCRTAGREQRSAAK